MSIELHDDVHVQIGVSYASVNMDGCVLGFESFERDV